MKNFLNVVGSVVFLVVSFFGLAAIAQAQAPNDGLHIDLSAAFTSVTSAPSVVGQNATATVFTLRAPITDRLAGRIENITLPSEKASLYFAEIEYRRLLSDVLKSKSLKFDASKFQLFAYGGIGGKKQDISTTPSIGYIAGGGVDRVIGNVALRLADIAYVRSDLSHPGVILSSNNLSVSAGVGLRF